MLTFAICDSDIEYLVELKMVITNWASERNVSVQVRSYDSILKFDSDWEDNFEFDALFFNIITTKGVKQAEIVRKQNSSIPIVFITNNPNTAFRFHHLNLAGHLAKPMDMINAISLLDLILKRLMHSNGQVFHRSITHNRIITIPYRNIVLFQSNDHRIEIITDEHFAGGTFAFYSTMNQLLDQLSSDGRREFIRIHRAYIVNMNYIYEISNSMAFFHDKNVRELTIGRKYLYDFIQVYEHYVRYLR